MDVYRLCEGRRLCYIMYVEESMQGYSGNNDQKGAEAWVGTEVRAARGGRDG